ncbi:MAG: C10 family peptidase, partial [candidate division Zixibacteria bacterium]|nr:C10 family peptidase [candidate division Zixibacteria bacterium]
PAAGNQWYDPSQKQGWARLAVPTKDFRVEAAQGTTSSAGPLLTSSWHQGAPYNDLCPMGDGGRTVVGCVATATAQILKFWQWPATGLGSHYYQWQGDNSCGGTTPPSWLIVDFFDAYDWANIPDNCNSGCSPAQQAALAELNYEVGVALNMDYSRCGSGASTAYAAYVFPTYFKYKPTTQVFNRIDYTQQGWFDLIRSEIDAGRPMQYRINLHSIVCDGYRDEFGQLEFHMNYGWNEGHSTWYVLDNLYCNWITGEVCPWEEEFLVAGIEPQLDPVLAFQKAAMSDITPDGDSLVQAGETANLQVVVTNQGFDATSTMGILSTSDPYLTITRAQATFNPVIAWGAEGSTQVPFELTVAPDCPNPHVAVLRLDLSAAGGFAFADEFRVFIGDTPGFEDNVESGAGFWVSHSFTSSYVNEWHLETARSHSGTTSWKAGGAGGGAYADNSDGALFAPPLLLPTDAKLTFWHWIEAEDDANFMAWDGAIVMIRPSGGVWTRIAPVGGYPYTTLQNSSCGFGPGVPCYSGAHGWTEAVFDLSAYSGVVELMFRFSSDGAATREGWYIDDVWVGNTLGGSNVHLSLFPELSIDFESVLSRGITTARIAETGPLPPQGYAAVPAAPARYYDLATNATISGTASVCIGYEDADVSRDESTLKLLHYEGGAWVDVTTSLTPETNVSCGSAATLSPFLVGEKTSCCNGRVGDANGLGVYPQEVTISDIQTLVTAKFIYGTCAGYVPCLAEGDVNQSGGTNPTCSSITISDIQALVNHLFIAGPANAPLNSCL